MEDSTEDTFTVKLEKLARSLRREIVDLRETLDRIDKHSTQSVDGSRPTLNTERIFNVLQDTSNNKLHIELIMKAYSHASGPIHDLLFVGPLTRTEIPLDVLNQLITVGFELNRINSNYMTCLDIAVEKHHYNAIRLLVKHGARSKSDTPLSATPPVISLASQPNVPLDLFDLLTTSQNLNDYEKYASLPLHQAVSCGHINTALHLIKLGAKVDQQDGFSKLPIEYLMEKRPKLENIGPLMRLLPQRGHGAHILKPICEILLHGGPDKNNTCVFQLVHQLMQRLHFYLPLKVKIRVDPFYSTEKKVCIVLNKETVHASKDGISLAMGHLCSLILTELQFDFTSTPREIADTFWKSAPKEELSVASAIDSAWRTYREQCRVRSLLRLCILQTRNSMSSLDDESFLSLPVPPYIRKLLTYHDVSERIFEERLRGQTMCS